MSRPTWSDHAFVVPAYKQSPFLEACLQSLIGQSLGSRVVLATSTPTDGLERIGRAYGIELIVNPDARGIGADWNFALHAVGQRFVTLAHQDDLYYPAFLSQTRDSFSRDSDGVLCFTGYDEVDDLGRLTSSKISRVKHLLDGALLGRRRRVCGWRLRAFLSFGNPLPCSSVTFDKSRLADFSFREDMVSNLDWDAWLRLYSQGVVLLRQPGRLIGRRHNPLTETSRLILDGRRQQEDEAMFARLWPPAVARAVAYVYRLGY